MIKRVLIYNSGGGIGDSIQLLPLINTLRSKLKNTKFYYLSAHQNHFDSTLKDFNCKIATLDLNIKYFGFRWWHLFHVKKNIKKNNIDFFDLIIDLQTKIRNTVSHRQNAREIGGTDSTPPLATIVFVAIKIGWINKSK